MTGSTSNSGCNSTAYNISKSQS